MEKKFLSDQPALSAELAAELREILHAVEALPTGIAVADLQGRLLYVNDRIVGALGYEREDMAGRDIRALCGPTMSHELMEEILQATFAGGWNGELTSYRKDGSTFPIFLETSALRGRGGEPMAVVGIARDITEQRAFQRRLVAEEKLGTLDLIAHNVAHEVRNHLSAIKMSLYMLQSERKPEGDEELHFSIARDELNRTELFLRTLVNYARPPRPRPEPTRLVDAVNQGLEDAKPYLVLKSVALFRQFPQTAPTLLLDRAQFSQAVTQLVQNASEAMEHQGEVHVVIKRQPLDEGTWWLVEVRDNGPGVAPHLQERVFEPFFSTTTNQMGLGLSNVRRIMQLHGGEAALSSTPGRGTVVTLRIPERPPEVEA